MTLAVMETSVMMALAVMETSVMIALAVMETSVMMGLAVLETSAMMAPEFLKEQIWQGTVKRGGGGKKVGNGFPRFLNFRNF